MNTNKYFKLILIFSISALTLSSFIFKDNFFSFYFYLLNILYIFSFYVVYLYLFKKTKSLYNLEYKIFWNSFLLRIIIIFITYIILDKLSSGDIGIEEYDSVFYDNFARILSNFYKNGIYNSDVKSFSSIEFDDKGYIFILSFIYYIFDNIIFSKLIQGLIDSFSAVLFYKIAYKIFNIDIARLSGIIYSTFIPMIIFSSLHTKEVFMIFFMLLALYNSINIVNRGFSFYNLLFVVLSLIFLFSMRYLLGLIVLISILYYILTNYTSPFILLKYFLPLFIFVAFFYTIKYINVDAQITEKLTGYLGKETTEEVKIGGRSINEIENKGQKYARYATGLILLPQAIITPYPSFVLTNITNYDITMQWFFAGGLFIWSYLSFFAFIGIYQVVKYNFKKSSIITIVLGFYIFVLLASVYITSIRFNLPKLVLLLFFTAVGLNYKFKNQKRNFIIYNIIISVIIIGWNYIKLAGRGIV